MPRIPGCAEAISNLVSTRLAYPTVASPENIAALAQFEAMIPKPYHMTADRLGNDVNLIRGLMGRPTEGTEEMVGRIDRMRLEKGVDVVDAAEMGTKEDERVLTTEVVG